MEKVSKAAVNYREAEGKQRCGTCGMFHKGNPGKCDLVLGDIYAKDTCTEWVNRDA